MRNFWLNDTTGVLASCEQLRPVIENGRMVKGYLVDGVFTRDPKGPDILHEAIPGQDELPEDHARIRAIRGNPQATGGGPGGRA